MLANHRKPLDIPLFLASQIVLFIVTIPAFISRPAQVIAFAVVGWYSYRILVTQTTGDFNSDMGIGSALLSQYIVALDFALLTPPDVLRDFHDNDRTSVTQRSFKKRVVWVLKLFSNPRCIGWAHEPSCLPPRPSPSTPRPIFVFSRIFLAMCCFLIASGTRLFDAAYAATTTADKLLTGAPLPQRVLGVLSLGLGGVCTISGLNAVLSAGIVGCGLSSPERWPLFFGSPLDVWSIRRFWRIFYHQMIRRQVVTCTSPILGCIFPASYVGTTGYKLARLYIAFFISGFLHFGGDVMATGRLGFKTFTFFMLQPFGITIEIGVSYLWRRLQPANERNSQKKSVNGGSAAAPQQHHNGHLSTNTEEPIPPVWIRCVGFIWVTLWMMWTAAYMADGIIFARLLSTKPGQI